MDEIHDSPTGWVAKHIKQYVESDGAKGHQFHGAPTLLLTTTGRKSGLLRRTALIYDRDGDDYVIVASLGGSPKHPLWYLNLVDDPKVGVQVEADRFDAVARTATAEEKARLWPRMVEVWPAYADYQKKTSREIPVVILSRQ
ncbi:nitroreductase family deazaflavin-dependent oxidoreductase [Nonomuraea sp. NPDC050663]|uniref:nitroreductase family deazaflavin-dependent oxidoreductase n=1 Tax=Nonomuraea sp. NPDC050663 TaxID=3364370 RepID=UPI0037B0636C